MIEPVRLVKKRTYRGVFRFWKWLVFASFWKFWSVVIVTNTLNIAGFSFIYWCLCTDITVNHFYFPNIREDAGYLVYERNLHNALGQALADATVEDKIEGRVPGAMFLSQIDIAPRGDGLVMQNIDFFFPVKVGEDETERYGLARADQCVWRGTTYSVLSEDGLRCTVDETAVVVPESEELSKALSNVFSAHKGVVRSSVHFWNTTLWISMRAVVTGIFLTDPKPMTWVAYLALLSQQLIGWTMFTFALAPRLALFFTREIKEALFG